MQRSQAIVYRCDKLVENDLMDDLVFYASQYEKKDDCSWKKKNLLLPFYSFIIIVIQRTRDLYGNVSEIRAIRHHPTP